MFRDEKITHMAAYLIRGVGRKGEPYPAVEADVPSGSSKL